MYWQSLNMYERISHSKVLIGSQTFLIMPPKRLTMQEISSNNGIDVESDIFWTLHSVIHNKDCCYYICCLTASIILYYFLSLSIVTPMETNALNTPLNVMIRTFWAMLRFISVNGRQEKQLTKFANHKF